MVVALAPARGGVGAARLRREVVAVHDVAAVGRQGAHLRGSRSSLDRGFANWPGHPAHLHDRLRRRVGQHDGHLEDRLDPVADLVGSRPREGLRAVTALQQEGVAAGPLARAARAGRSTSPANTSGGRVAIFGGRRGDRIPVRPFRLLLDRAVCANGPRPAITLGSAWTTGSDAMDTRVSSTGAARVPGALAALAGEPLLDR